jgi:hypothetical protein
MPLHTVGHHLQDSHHSIHHGHNPAGTAGAGVLCRPPLHGAEKWNKNETIGLTRSRDTTCCPILVMIQWVQHLRAHQMPPLTPLSIYLKQGVPHHITDHMITDHLRHAGVAVNQPQAYTVGTLQNTGAQTLLQAQVPLPMIKLIGRWCLEEVF